MDNPHAIVAGAAFDLLGFVAVDLGMASAADHERLLKSVRRWAASRQIHLIDADIQHWRKRFPTDV